MKKEFSEAFPESYAMKGGEGPHSYAQNSTIQAFNFNLLLPLITTYTYTHTTYIHIHLSALFYKLIEKVDGCLSTGITNKNLTEVFGCLLRTTLSIYLTFLYIYIYIFFFFPEL